MDAFEVLVAARSQHLSSATRNDLLRRALRRVVAILLLFPLTVWAFEQADHDFAVEIAKQQVADMLKDSESARFSDIYTLEHEKRIDVCGKVNAKNSYGGYTGKTPFVSRFSVVPGQPS